MERCTKCNGSHLMFELGYTKEGLQVKAYNYLHCPICGFVKHLYNPLDRKAYISERVHQIGHELHVSVPTNGGIKTRVYSSTLGPK